MRVYRNREHTVYYIVLTALCMTVCAASLTGCGSDRKSQQSAQAVTSDLISDVTEPEGEESDSASASVTAKAVDYSEGTQDLRVNADTVGTQFYNVSVPEEWQGLVTYRYYQMPEDEVYKLEIYDNASAVATDGVGGLVASLILTRSYGEETTMKSTEYLGRLLHEGGDFYYLLIEYPPHEQYTEGSRTTYDSVLLGVRSMGSRIEGADSYTFEAGAPAQQSDETESEE